MDVLLLGTGSGDGWPNPFCECASCDAVRRLGPGAERGQSSALVDGRLLLDAGPDVALAASRHGASLAGVEAILLTHAHPDHVGPQLLLWRGWAGRREPLDWRHPFLLARIEAERGRTRASIRAFREAKRLRGASSFFITLPAAPPTGAAAPPP